LTRRDSGTDPYFIKPLGLLFYFRTTHEARRRACQP